MSSPRRILAIEPRPEPSPESLYGWSVPLAPWPGIMVRVHVTLAVVLVLAVGACWWSGEPIAWLALSAYLTSLFIHEAAHLAASTRSRHPLGRRASEDPVILGPLGGMRVIGADGDARERVFCAMAGPLASLALVVGSLFLLTMGGVELDVATLLNPREAIAAAAAAEATPITTLAPLMILINWPLFAVNLAPASPFDGGIALRSWLQVWMDRRAARDATCVTALLVSAGLLGAAGALILTQSNLLPVATTLAVLSVVIAFGAARDAVLAEGGDAWPDPLDDDLGISLSELPRPSIPEGLRTGRSELRHADPFDEDLEYLEQLWDEDRIDDILLKVHRSGLAGLTANERALLERASEHYQRRRRDDA
ncbi:Peptidase family M50 [Planctomycetes bacterium MalM25]|nr:Peptidase family M50 [Planctomycetes bacterium MalM25]